jgi:bifunctional oligoribonuclease and PAP phosphatase NrnA
MQSLTEQETELEKIANIIDKNHKFLIITHDFPDGDCLGSQIALYDLLINLKKDVGMICTSGVPYQYSFLPYSGLIKKGFAELSVNCIDRECICFCLDSADEKRFSLEINTLREKTGTLINIDHHLGNSMYGDINFVNSSKSATAEMVYEFISRHYRKYFNYNIAVGLYTGILTDTGKFQYENTTNDVHKIISNLLGYGVVPSTIYSYIYENEPFERFGLIDIVLQRVKVSESKKLIYSYVLQKDFEKLGLPFSANDGIIELLRTTAGIKIAALIKQVGIRNFKVSLRSSDRNYSVVDIAAKFGGGGHRLAGAYSQDGTLKDIIRKLEDAVTNAG